MNTGEVTKKQRKIIQVLDASVGGTYGGDHFKGAVLCDDGTLWVIHEYGPWRQIKEVPQPAETTP